MTELSRPTTGIDAVAHAVKLVGLVGEGASEVFDLEELEVELVAALVVRGLRCGVLFPELADVLWVYSSVTNHDSYVTQVDIHARPPCTSSGAACDWPRVTIVRDGVAQWCQHSRRPLTPTDELSDQHSNSLSLTM